MKFSQFKIIQVLVVGMIVLQSLILAFYMRPMQDDYLNLQSVQQMGLWGYLADTWQSHGGNMVQFFIHCLVILPTTQTFVFWNFAAFFLVNQLLVLYAVRTSLRWLFPNKPRKILFWIPLLSVAGFEGLFVPGFIGTFGFSLATLAHLWPVMAVVIGLLGLKKFRGSWLIALALGFIAGNSNLGESAFAVGTILLIWIAAKKLSDFESRADVRVDSNFYTFMFGALTGTIGIAAAPGFWVRASDQIGLPNSPLDFGFRFIKSFASFSADALSHPMIWVLFMLGMLFATKDQLALSQHFRFRLRILCLGSILIWLSLIFGATFAYPSWHQSMGMYVLLFPCMFGLGILTKWKFLIKNLSTLMILASLVMAAIFLRIGALGIERGKTWDRNLITNACSLKADPEAALLGAEIRYPPFGLGVEDVNTWEWMRDKYAGWIQQMPDQFNCGN
jgi:hypothetical protein